ncbi:MAG: hypothetical protein KatS3mg068_0006 [Candidatus Sericytochromatia bacterium]|nr:MAG: hypothetical protein KatS3mg068_0006 [Candidatus Sericytochromatia bacterium]
MFKSFYYKEFLNVFSLNYINKLKENILNSPYLTKNHLNYNFNSTLGFSVVFKKNKIDYAISKFPYFDEYIKKIFDKNISIYYLNPLVIPINGKVGKHIDYSLNTYCYNINFPKKVSVLYISCKNINGGNLNLIKRNKIIATIEPLENKLVIFKGNLKHEVTKVINLDENYRISLVCEMYNVSDSNLEKIPDFFIRSKASFKTFLEQEVKE